MSVRASETPLLITMLRLPDRDAAILLLCHISMGLYLFYRTATTRLYEAEHDQPPLPLSPTDLVVDPYDQNTALRVDRLEAERLIPARVKVLPLMVSIPVPIPVHDTTRHGHGYGTHVTRTQCEKCACKARASARCACAQCGYERCFRGIAIAIATAVGVGVGVGAGAGIGVGICVGIGVGTGIGIGVGVDVGIVIGIDIGWDKSVRGSNPP